MFRGLFNLYFLIKNGIKDGTFVDINGNNICVKNYENGKLEGVWFKYNKHTKKINYVLNHKKYNFTKNGKRKR